MGFPPCPPEIRSVAHLLKIAEEHESRNLVVAYWARFSVVNTALTNIPGQKSPELSELLKALLTWLEKTRKENPSVEGLYNEAVAQALIEEYALNIFEYADKQDKAEIFNKNTIKAFYTSGIIMDILDQFGMPEELVAKRKYAKWKAAYLHNCLKNNKTPGTGDPFNPEEKLELEPPDMTTGRFLTESEKSMMNDFLAKRPQLSPKTDSETPTNDLILAPAPAPSPVTPSVPSNDNVPFNNVSSDVPTTSKTALDPMQIMQAQKLSKLAVSALNYDDVKTAIENLESALKLLKVEK